jgi:predicted transcriptional regulator
MKAEKNYEIEIDKLTDIVNAQLEVINIKNRVLGETKENLEKLIRAMDRDPKLDKIKKIEGSIKETLNSVNTLLQSTAKLANEYIIAVAKLKGDNKLEEV